MERFIKPSIALGVISGIIFGILLLMPFISPLMFFLMFLLAGIIVIVVLKKTSTAGIITLQDGTILGSIAGFVSLLSASAVYIPSAYLIKLVFNNSPGGPGIGRTFAMTGYDLMAVFMLVIFTAVLSAILNAFTAMLTSFIFSKLENHSVNFKDHLYMEQFDDTVE